MDDLTEASFQRKPLSPCVVMIHLSSPQLVCVCSSSMFKGALFIPWA